MKPVIYIILASYNPNIPFLEKQLNSISNQTYEDWKCIITDDKSDDAIASQIAALALKDSRFSVRTNPKRRGVFHNFESGLKAIPGQADFIFYSDQDDIWKADKIQKTLEALKDDRTTLVHSDLEIIDENDAPIHPSCFKLEQRDLNDFSVKKLIVKNSVTGCTVAFRGTLLKNILPFPTLGNKPAYHHDLWTALHAAKEGTIKVINTPLIQYRQHSNNVVGADKRTLSEKLFKMNSRAEWLVRKKIIYDFIISFTPEKSSQSLNQWITRPPVSLGLFFFFLKLFFTGNKDWAVCYHMMIGKAKEFFEPKNIPFPQKIKSAFRLLFSLRKKRARSILKSNFIFFLKDSSHKINSNDANTIAHLPVEYISTALFKVTLSEEKTYINLILPTLKPEHIFGGISTAVKFALALTPTTNLRFISIEDDFDEAQAQKFKEVLKTQFKVDDEKMSRISFLDNTAAVHLFSSNDLFIATFWITAIKINNTLKRFDFKCKKFIYLIQDYEPGFYAWSDFYALCASTYRMNFWGVYNTMLLAEYFESQEKLTINRELVLNPEIDWKRYSPPSKEAIITKQKRRIVYYGRPGCPRNLFETGLTGMKLWVAQNNITSEEVEVISAGEIHPDVNIGNGIIVSSVGKLTLEEYGNMLRESDLGISLMLTPHPSYPPFEMVASGMIVITNFFENKNLNFSPNIISVYPSPSDIAEALEKQWPSLSDAERRISGSKVSIQNLGQSIQAVVETLRKELEQETKRIS